MPKEDNLRRIPPGLGARLFRARQAVSSPGNTVSQSDAGEAIGKSGVTVGRWEQEKDEPSLMDLIGLARLYRCDVAEMTFGSVDERAAYAAAYLPLSRPASDAAATLDRAAKEMAEAKKTGKRAGRGSRQADG